MKTRFFLMPVLFTALLPLSADHVLNNGFYAAFFLGLPGEDYSMAAGEATPDNYEMDLIFGGQFGSRWYFNNEDRIGLGLLVNWVDIAASQKDVDALTVNSANDIALVETGPLLTFAPDNQLGFDLYYQLRPTLMINRLTYKEEGNEKIALRRAMGFAHTAGVALRLSRFHLALEYTGGSLWPSGTNGTEHPFMGSDPSLSTNSLRLGAGLEFTL